MNLTTQCPVQLDLGTINEVPEIGALCHERGVIFHTDATQCPGKVPLEIIEVQSGSYLGEDDIERFEDRYGRG